MANQDKKQEGLFEPLKNETYIDFLDGIYYQAYAVDETHVTELGSYAVVKEQTKRLRVGEDFRKAALEWSIRFLSYHLHHYDEGLGASAYGIQEKLIEELGEMSIGFIRQCIDDILPFKAIAFEEQTITDFVHKYEHAEKPKYVVNGFGEEHKISPEMIRFMLSMAMQSELLYQLNRVKSHLRARTDEAFWRKYEEMEGEEFEDSWENAWNGICSVLD